MYEPTNGGGRWNPAKRRSQNSLTVSIQCSTLSSRGRLDGIRTDMTQCPDLPTSAEPIKTRTTGPIEPLANAQLHPLWCASRLNGFQALKRHTERSPSCSLTQPRFLDEREAALHLLCTALLPRRVGSDGRIRILLEPLPDAMMRVLRGIEHVVLVTHELRAHGALAVNYFVRYGLTVANNS